MISLWDSVETDLGLALQTDVDLLRRELRPLCALAALLHDVGKANSAFQSIVRGERAKRQPVRHEVLSALLVSSPHFLGPWLRGAFTESELWAVSWAVGGHHLQMRQRAEFDREDPLLRVAGAHKEVTLYLGHPEIASLLAGVKGVLAMEGKQLPSPPSLQDVTYTIDSGQADTLEPLLRTLIQDSKGAWSRCRTNQQIAKQVAALKALLIAADVGGSALHAERLPIAEWIAKALNTRLSDPMDLDRIVEGHLNDKEPLNFQREAAESKSPVTLLIAGCGSGKTVAAYLWAKKHAIGRKLFFAYPTTGTTSAGFEDYLLAQTNLERALIHGRAQVDLEAMLGSPEDSGLEEAMRLESLKAWGQQVIACTVDSVLGLIQNQRRALFSFPAIACGAFVFDEIHNYDQRLFGELLTFLRTFSGAPVLLMSASIPPARLDALRRALSDRMGEPIPGEPELENRRRYLLENRPSATECWPEVLRALKNAERVLWVCNTVSDAVGIFRDARTRGLQPLVYHSRFRYRDRVNRQNEVLAAFKDPPKPSLIIATQVCEMSLNISAELLVTALAPLPSLVQRMGRLNRFAEEGDPPRRCLVYPFKGRPYDTPEDRRGIDAAQKAIAGLAGKPCSQTDLAEHLARMLIGEEWTETSAWLDGGWESEPLPARESGYTLTVVREEDIHEMEHELGPEGHGRWTSQRLVPWTIPMPINSSRRFERRIGGYPLFSRGEIDYDLAEGALWHR